MVIRSTDMKNESRVNMRDGNGTILITHLEDPEKIDHCRLMASIVIPEGASIGEHEHNAETEYYIVLEGNAIVSDNGVDTEVGPGDVVVTGDGGSHSIRNSGSGVMKMIAVIITEK